MTNFKCGNIIKSYLGNLYLIDNINHSNRFRLSSAEAYGIEAELITNIFYV